MLEGWPVEVRGRTQYRLYNITSPDDPDARGWVNPRWRPCSNHRLFLPSFLPEVDAVIYLDSDILLLSPVEQVWSVFGQFDDQQMIAAAQESQSGLNSGVLLMNLTRMRHSTWTKGIVHYTNIYRKKLILPDQDLINIYFHFQPEKLFRLDCWYNYRTDHCRNRDRDPSSVCATAERHGAFILHGNRMHFRGDNPLGPIYSAFKKHTVGGSLSHTLTGMQRGMKGGRSLCSNVTSPYFKRLANTVADIQILARTDPAMTKKLKT
ncbi:hypothetical protein ACOMHN_007603 [Nucella lapillus]